MHFNADELYEKKMCLNKTVLIDETVLINETVLIERISKLLKNKNNLISHELQLK